MRALKQQQLDSVCVGLCVKAENLNRILEATQFQQLKITFFLHQQ